MLNVRQKQYFEHPPGLFSCAKHAPASQGASKPCLRLPVLDIRGWLLEHFPP